MNVNLQLKSAGRPQYVLNFTDTCTCGRRKDIRLQWCEHCFELLPQNKRNYFETAVSRLRRYIGRLEALLLSKRTK